MDVRGSRISIFMDVGRVYIRIFPWVYSEKGNYPLNDKRRNGRFQGQFQPLGDLKGAQTFQLLAYLFIFWGLQSAELGFQTNRIKFSEML